MSKLSQRLPWFITIIVIVVSGLIVLVKVNQCESCLQDGQVVQGDLPKVSLGLPLAPGMALVMVAQDQGLFESQGVDVEVEEFTAGKFALQAFLGGSLDMVVLGELPVVFSTMQGNKFVVPAQIVGKTQNAVRVVARRDGKLTQAVDYFKEKRKLATSFGGGPEFFTAQFLKSIGLPEGQVELVSVAPGDMPAAIINGSVDAIAIFDPPAFKAEKELGEKGITFKDENLPSEIYILGAQESVRQDSVLLEKVLEGLIEAEGFVRDNPQEAKEIVAGVTQLDQEILDAIWDNFEFEVVLTQELIDMWQAEANWARQTGKVDKEAGVPDFRGVVFEDVLKKIEPERVEF